MKCGRCRISNALSYTKITEGHQLFEALKSIIPGRIYNDNRSYFCNSCMALATNRFQSFNESSLAVQNSNSLSARNSSFATSNVSIKVEYDLLVPPQIVDSDTGSLQLIRPIPSRALTFKTKPCPKRFKKQVTTTLASNENANVSNVGEQGFEEQNRIVSAQISYIESPLSHLQQGIAGPSAPALRRPRIRKPNIDLRRNDLRRYFQENEQDIDVNNYSRLTAG